MKMEYNQIKFIIVMSKSIDNECTQYLSKSIVKKIHKNILNIKDQNIR